MESFLSLDELHISFPDRELRFEDSRIEDQHSEEACDLLREDVSRQSSPCRANNVDKHSRSKNEDFLLGNDHVVVNKAESRDTYAGKLPNICPATSRTRLKNGVWKKRRTREFSCIDVDDFEVWGKTKTYNENRGIEEKDKRSASTRRNHLPFTKTDGCLGGQNWKNDPVVDLESLRLNLTRGIQTHSSEQNGFFAASPRNIFSPRQSLRSSAEMKGRGKQWTETHIQELPLNLPEKVTKFLQMEISLIKGREQVHSMQKRRGSALTTYCVSEDTERFCPKSMELKKSWDSSLLDKRRHSEKTGCYNKRNLDPENSRM